MRTCTCLLLLLAVAGCSADSDSSPVEVATKRLAAAPLNPEPQPNRPSLDPRPIAMQIEELVTKNMVPVEVVPDELSLAADATHASVVRFAQPWNGTTCLFGYTPYKNSDNSFENPSMEYCATDKLTVPVGAHNPIITYPGGGAYNSDIDLVPDQERVVMSYREVSADGYNNIKMLSTANGKTWTKPQLAFREKSHDAVSQSVVLDAARQARIWYVRSGAAGCNSTSTTVAMRTAKPDSAQRLEAADWSAAQIVSMPSDSQVVWHLQVTALPFNTGYLMLKVQYKRGDTCSNDDLWLASGSADGLKFDSYAVPVVWRGMALAKKYQVLSWYRGTLLYDPASDTVELWLSALVGNNPFTGKWRMFHASGIPYTQLMTLLRIARPSDYAAVYSRSSANLNRTPTDFQGRQITMP